MRAVTWDELSSAERHDLLTTGEAAKILNSSRQHVVDLCDRGDLPFVTVGTHRRVSRADVEAVRTRSERMTRDQRKSLWLAHAVAGAIVQDPDPVISAARTNLARMRTAHGRGQVTRWLDEWARLLEGPVEELLATLTSTSPRARELRQNNPFADVLSHEEREQVFAAFSQNRSKP